MKCDIIIPIWNQREITKDCIDSIVRNTKYPYRLILIDNASDSDTKLYLESVCNDRSLDVKLIRNEQNLGFVKAVNQGLKISTAPYVCIFNNDTVTTPGWLEEMVEFVESHKDIGIVNPICDGHGQMSRDEYAKILAKNNKGKYMETNQCFLFCTLIKREVIDKIGHLDEVFGVGCFDDTDFSMRAGIAGYRCACLHSAYVHHIHGVSFKAMGNRDSIVARCEKEFFKKWPRHLRIGLAFSLSDSLKDDQIADILRAMLYLAREWCWINLWVFGDKKSAKERMAAVAGKIGLPLHQNIRFNYFPDRFKDILLFIKLIERSFGTKRRKKHDAILVDNERTRRFLMATYPLHRNKIWCLAPGRDMTETIRPILSELRSKK